MRFDIISAVPKLLESPFQHSIMKRAVDNGLLHLEMHNLREYGIGNQNQIDDYQYGGGAGMVMMCEPLHNLISELKEQREYDEIIYLTPDGIPYKQGIANRMSLLNNIILICGHYKGIDQRIRDIHVTSEISIGDYVISGGELAACVLVDSITRLIPKVINDETSALSDSFQDNLLSYPVYTRPANFMEEKVPDVLLSGHQKNIDEWRHEKSLEITKKNRPDLLDEKI